MKAIVAWGVLALMLVSVGGFVVCGCSAGASLPRMALWDPVCPRCGSDRQRARAEFRTATQIQCADCSESFLGPPPMGFSVLDAVEYWATAD